MDLEHSFTVPVGVDSAWAEFQDIASIAECFPGATVSSVEDDAFSGSVKVKLGPIALTYNGSGRFTEKDEASHRFVVEAKGKDKRGNGTAGATVTVAMTGTGDSTDATVHTDLAITGKPAQFGRGVMQDVSDKLLGQFVTCLEQRLTATTTPAPPAPETSAPAAPPIAEPVASDPTTAAPETPVAPVAPVAPGVTPPVATPRPTPSRAASGSDDALDLGRTVLPVLVRSYWKQALAVVVVLVVVVWLIAR
jgi:carbon monoxide dehydrogenase subunit G